MMPTLLADLAPAPLRLQPGQRTKGNITFYALATPDGKPLSFLLGPVGSYPATVPFEPSVFGGHGGEPRKAMRFAVVAGLLEATRASEEQACELVREVDPRIQWNSVAATPRGYSGSIKAKVWVSGERACAIRDDQGNPTPMPGQPWPRPSANAAIEVRGVCRQGNGAAGLILQVAALQLKANEAPEQQQDPVAF